MEGLFWSRRPNCNSLAPTRRIEKGVVVEEGVETLKARITTAMYVENPKNKNVVDCVTILDCNYRHSDFCWLISLLMSLISS